MLRAESIEKGDIHKAPHPETEGFVGDEYIQETQRFTAIEEVKTEDEGSQEKAFHNGMNIDMF